MAKLNELLTKYKQLPIVEKILLDENCNPKFYITIEKKVINEKTVFVVEPTEEFKKNIASIAGKIYLDSKLKLVKSECGCLEFYRKKECAHTTILYGLAIMALSYERFEREIQIFQQSKIAVEHGEILDDLANNLRSNSTYFNKIHLAVEINKSDGYVLYLRISHDKEYVIKNIPEFFDNMLGHKHFSYGQKLKFIHSFEVLDAESKEIYSFLLNIANEEKKIKLQRNSLLTLLELCRNSGIYYSEGDEKAIFYPITEIHDVAIRLNDYSLYLDKPRDSKEFICGRNYAYFLGEDKIYAYHFKKRNESIIFNTLFKLDNSNLLIEANSTGFISNLLPVLKSEVQIDPAFYLKYPLPNVDVESVFVYRNGKIILEEKINVEDKYRNTPYVKQILEGYYESIERLGFIKGEKGLYELDSIEHQYLFITSDLTALKSYGEVYFDNSIKKITIKRSGRVQINVSYNVGLLDFKFDGGMLSLEEVQAMLLAYRENKKFVKLKNDVILEIKEEDAKELDNFLEDFNISIEDITNGTQKHLSYVLKFVAARNNGLVCYDDEIVEMIDKIQNYRDNPNLPCETFMPKLRPYQIDAYKWMDTLASFGFGGILADDMGLGKTIEILSFITSDNVNCPSIIVCPMSLIYNWENECNKWNLDIPVVLILGGALEREEIIKNIDFNKKSIYITSYDSLRRDIDFYNGTFRFVIADEAQYIKNQNALKSTAIKKLKSQMNFALTGTPIENGLSDLWSIFDYLMPGYLADYNHFKNRYEELIIHNDDEALKLLKKRVQPFILRRTKKNVLKELPDKMEEIFYCKMDEKQKEIYNAYAVKLKEEIRQGGNDILALITRLRQICITPELFFEGEFNSSKIALCVELVKRAIGSGHRILLFSQFAATFPIISKQFDSEGICYQILDGQTKAHQRLEMVEEFNHNQDVKVFMISLKAGGTGLNLTGADIVIHLDPWWNVSAENQATDRAYRIGQTKNVHVLKLVCKDTIEEKVLLLQKVKSDLASNVISTEDNNKMKLSKKDILEMLE